MFSTRLSDVPFNLFRFDGEPSNEQQPPVQQQTITPNSNGPIDLSRFTSEQLKRMPELQNLFHDIRREEKEKLYPEITGLRTNVEKLTQDLDARQAEKAKAEEDRKRDDLLKMTLEERLEARQKESEAMLAEIQRRADERINLMEQNYQRQQLATRRAELMHEHGIDKKFGDFVQGNSEDDLLRSINLIKAVRAEQGTAQPSQLPAGTQFPPANAGLMNPAVGGIDDVSTEQKLLEAARNADFNDPKVRQRLLLGASGIAKAQNS